MTRRLQHIADPSWQPWLLVAEAGAVVIMCGICARSRSSMSASARASSAAT